MNWYAVKNRIKYGWKKQLAIFFASIGTAIQITLFALCFVGEGFDFLGMISYGIVLLAYYYLLSGNIKGTTTAYRGFMLFVFFNFFDFAQYFLFNLLDAGGIFMMGDPLDSGIFIVSLAFMLLGFVSGLMTYINFRRYMTFGYKTTYETVRNWCLVFTICITLSYGSQIVLQSLILSGAEGFDWVSIFIVLLEPISIVIMGLCSFFTILRLKD